MFDAIKNVVQSVLSMGPKAFEGEIQQKTWNGNKFNDSFGPTIIFEEDYWISRARSVQLFTENLYARGLIRRYITNIINTGLSPEVDPLTSILGLEDGSLDDWGDNVKYRFSIWANNPKLCDYKGVNTFWKIQRIAKQTALVSGDVLRVLRFVKGQALPLVQLIDGTLVQTPLLTETNLPKGWTIVEGVEMDERKRHVAFWITQEDGKSKRLAAVDKKTGRPVAKLIYGIDNKIDAVRGTPLLMLIAQSIKEMDRYRDSAQRSATIQSLLAMFIQKDEDVISSNPITSAAVRADTQTAEPGSRQYTKSVTVADMNPGVVAQEMNVGEKVVAFEPKGAVNFKEFEEVIVQAMAWATETPPEILKLSFSSNYAASQAANSEYLMFLNKERQDWGKEFCQETFQEWFITEVLTRKIKAEGFIKAWRTPDQYDIFGAWLNNQWSGAIKPASDIVKTGKGYKLFVDNAWITNTRAAKETTGQDFSRNVKQIARENVLLAEAQRPLLEMALELKAAAMPEQNTTEAISALAENITESIEDLVDVST